MGKEVPSQNGKAEMIKRAFSILLAILLIAACTGVTAQGVVGGRAGLLEEPPEEPTPAPTSEPTPAPTAVPTDDPIPPTDPPVTPVPSETVQPSDPPVTPPPTETAAPSETPTPTPTVEPSPTPKPALEITTDSHLPHAVVDSSYSVKLSANYADAVFSDSAGFFSSIGLKLSATGQISGKPTRSGHFTVTVTAVSASAGGSANKRFNINVYEPGETTPPPTEPPAPTESAEPSAQPTDFPVDPNGRLWTNASDTLVTVTPDEAFDIVLIEGISGEITSLTLTGELPSGVEFADALESERCCRISGSLPNGGAAEFSVDLAGEERTVSFRFRISAGTVSAVFPDGIRLVPFGGAAKTALLPTGVQRKEEKEDEQV